MVDKRVETEEGRMGVEVKTEFGKEEDTGHYF